MLEINLHYIEIHVCLTRCYYTIMYIGNIAYDSSRMLSNAPENMGYYVNMEY